MSRARGELARAIRRGLDVAGEDEVLDALLTADRELYRPDALALIDNAQREPALIERTLKELGRTRHHDGDPPSLGSADESMPPPAFSRRRGTDEAHAWRRAPTVRWPRVRAGVGAVPNGCGGEEAGPAAMRLDRVAPGDVRDPIRLCFAFAAPGPDAAYLWSDELLLRRLEAADRLGALLPLVPWGARRRDAGDRPAAAAG